MNRRHFQLQLASLAFGAPLAGCVNAATSPWAEIERSVQGRLGVAVLDTGSGRLTGHRLDERFPMCSTFKWLLAAAVLQRVDRGDEQAQRRIRYGREALVPHSPATEPQAGREGLTVAQLCDAAVTLSDNTAANLLLQTMGGPAGLTAYARSLGDRVTRLDRLEPELNESLPGDPRDTTSPRAMAGLLQKVVLGDALTPPSRALLVGWLEATRTNTTRLRAGLPDGWRMGSKTGTGARGSTNDAGVFWPPAGRAPIIVAAYLTETTAPEAARHGAIASVAKRVTSGV